MISHIIFLVLAVYVNAIPPLLSKTLDSKYASDDSGDFSFEKHVDVADEHFVSRTADAEIQNQEQSILPTSPHESKSRPLLEDMIDGLVFEKYRAEEPASSHNVNNQPFSKDVQSGRNSKEIEVSATDFVEAILSNKRNKEYLVVWWPYETKGSKLRLSLMTKAAQTWFKKSDLKQLYKICDQDRPRIKKSKKGNYNPDDLLKKLLEKPVDPKNDVPDVMSHRLNVMREELSFIFKRGSTQILFSKRMIKQVLATLFTGQSKASYFDWLFDNNVPEVKRFLKAWNQVSNIEFWNQFSKMVAETSPTRYEQIVMLNAIIKLTPKSDKTFRYPEFISKVDIVEDLLATFKQNIFMTAPLYLKIAVRTNLPRDVGAHILQLALANALYHDPKNMIHSWTPMKLSMTTEKVPSGLKLDILPSPFTAGTYDPSEVRYLKHNKDFLSGKNPFTMPRGAILVPYNDSWFVTWTYIFDEESKSILSYQELMLKKAAKLPSLNLIDRLDVAFRYLLGKDESNEAKNILTLALKNVTEICKMYQVYDIFGVTLRAVKFLAGRPDERSVFNTTIMREQLSETVSYLTMQRNFGGFVFIFVCIALLAMVDAKEETLDYADYMLKFQISFDNTFNDFQGYRHRMMAFYIELFEGQLGLPGVENTREEGFYHFLDAAPRLAVNFSDFLPENDYRAEDLRQGRLYFNSPSSLEKAFDIGKELHSAYSKFLGNKDMLEITEWVVRLHAILENAKPESSDGKY